MLLHLDEPVSWNRTRIEVAGEYMYIIVYKAIIELLWKPDELNIRLASWWELNRG